MKKNTALYKKLFTLAVGAMFINSASLQATAQVAIITGDVNNIALQGTDNTQTLTTLATAIANRATSTEVTTLGNEALATAANLSTTNSTVNTINTGLTSDTYGLSAINTKVINANSSLDAIKGVSFNNSTDNLHAISTAIAGISPESGVATQSQVNNLGGSSDTSFIYSDFASLGSNGSGENPTDVSFIYADFASLGATEGDVSHLNTRLTAIEGTDFDANTDNLHAIYTAIAGISPESGVATQSQVNNLGGSSDTSFIYSDFASLGSNGSGENPTDVSFIYADFASLGATEGDVSNLNTRLTAIEGTDFHTATDSLVVISDKVGTPVVYDGNYDVETPPTGLYAQIGYAASFNDSEPQAVVPATGLYAQMVDIKGTDFDANTNSLVNLATAANLATLQTSINSQSTSLSSVESTLALLVAKLSIDPITQVSTANSNTALTTLLTFASPAPAGLAAYNTAISTARGTVTTAITFSSQRYANTVTAINSVNSAIAAFNTVAQSAANNSYVPTSGRSLAQIDAALLQLQASLGYLLINQTQALS